MIIDLHEYSKELDAYVAAARNLVDRPCLSTLEKLREDLASGQDYTTHFPWKTLKPIRTKETQDYDRQGHSAPPVFVEWNFRATFTHVPTPRRNSRWCIDEVTTQFKIWSKADTTRPALVFHIDRKNPGQLGPDFHMQVAEDYTAAAGPLRLAVPRFPSHCLLPTDCLDLVLSEFFQQEWSREQSEGAIDVLRSAQLARAKKYSEAITKMWSETRRRTPIAALQNFRIEKLNLS